MRIRTTKTAFSATSSRHTSDSSKHSRRVNNQDRQVCLQGIETACGTVDGPGSQIGTVEQLDFDGTVGHQLSDFIVRQVLGQIVG